MCVRWLNPDENDVREIRSTVNTEDEGEDGDSDGEVGVEVEVVGPVYAIYPPHPFLSPFVKAHGYQGKSGYRR